MSVYRGRLYWSERQVRCQLSGRLIDLGPKSLESACIVAEQLGLELVVDSPARSSAEVLRNVEKLSKGSFTGIEPTAPEASRNARRCGRAKGPP